MIPLTEAQFQRQVTDLAELNGWSWLHIERVGNEQGRWRTPVSGPLGKGFPDLLLVKGSRVLFAELKAVSGLLTPSQKDLLLGPLRDQECHVWRPHDWAQVLEVLSA